jgi:hypothetical protein
LGPPPLSTPVMAVPGFGGHSERHDRKTIQLG